MTPKAHNICSVSMTCLKQSAKPDPGCPLDCCRLSSALRLVACTLS